MRRAGGLRNTSSAYKNWSLQFYLQTHTLGLWLLDSTVSACVTGTLGGGGGRTGGVVGNKPPPSDWHTSHVRPSSPPTEPHCMICKNTRLAPTRSLLLALTHHQSRPLPPSLCTTTAAPAAAAVYLPDLSYCLVCHLQSLALWASLTDRGISRLCLVLRAGLSCWIGKLCMNATGKHVMTHTGTLPPTAAPQSVSASVCVCVCSSIKCCHNRHPINLI